jgi:hypothetical protein
MLFLTNNCPPDTVSKGILMRSYLATRIPLILVLLVPVTSHSGSLPERSQEDNIVITSSMSGCKADIQKHCDDPGDKTLKVFMCLMANEEDLSPACREGVLEAAMTIKTGSESLDYSISACESDVEAHCRGVAPGDGRIVGCIKANESRVSNACIAALKQTGLWERGK